MLDTYRKIHKLCDVLSYFTNRTWKFTNHNVQVNNLNRSLAHLEFNEFQSHSQNLWSKLEPKDKELFYFDMNDVDWSLFIKESMYGIRTYLMKEDPKNIPAALKRFQK